MNAKSKLVSSRPGPSIRGGSTKMFGKQNAGPQRSGTTATGGRHGGTAGKGGSTKMFGKQSAKPASSC